MNNIKELKRKVRKRDGLCCLYSVNQVDAKSHNDFLRNQVREKIIALEHLIVVGIACYWIKWF